MAKKRINISLQVIVISTVVLSATSCVNYPFLPGAGSNVAGASAVSPVFASGQAFTEALLQQRTFIAGTAVTTVTYQAGDLSRTPFGIDFNGDGKIDPVVSYGGTEGVFQIMLSRGAKGVVDYISLTLDSGLDIRDLSDVAVGDIDGDGALDVVGSSSGAIWYFHHPSGLATTELRAWGNPDPVDELRERIDASLQNANDPNQNITAIIAQAAGPFVNVDDYIITTENLFTNVEIGDMDNDGDNDIVSTRKFKINMTPRPDSGVVPILIVDGDVIVFLNPGFAETGRNWTKLSVGRHERQTRLDRDGATGLQIVDLDQDGDLDLVTTARDDNNVQVAWFENPNPPLNAGDAWTQWRIGSLRDARGVTVADLTRDGRLDVVAAGGEQMQMLLFEQPSTGPKRSYDWDTNVIVTFESYEPRDIVALDIDRDSRLELVVGGTDGALRFFESGANPRNEWIGNVIVTFDAAQEVSRLGYGDLDGDGDVDLVASLDAAGEVVDSRTVWIRNELGGISLAP